MNHGEKKITQSVVTIEGKSIINKYISLVKQQKLKKVMPFQSYGDFNNSAPFGNFNNHGGFTKRG